MYVCRQNRHVFFTLDLNRSSGETVDHSDAGEWPPSDDSSDDDSDAEKRRLLADPKFKEVMMWLKSNSRSKKDLSPGDPANSF